MSKRRDVEREEDEALRARMSDLLTRTANALKGDPTPPTSTSVFLHDWSDLPDVAARTVEALRVAVEALDYYKRNGGLVASLAISRIEAIPKGKP